MVFVSQYLGKSTIFHWQPSGLWPNCWELLCWGEAGSSCTSPAASLCHAAALSRYHTTMLPYYHAATISCYHTNMLPWRTWLMSVVFQYLRRMRYPCLFWHHLQRMIRSSSLCMHLSHMRNSNGESLIPWGTDYSTVEVSDITWFICCDPLGSCGSLFPLYQWFSLNAFCGALWYSDQTCQGLL